MKEQSKSKLSSYQQKKEEERKKLVSKTEGWNASFVRSDTIVDSLAERLAHIKKAIHEIIKLLGYIHICTHNQLYF